MSALFVKLQNGNFVNAEKFFSIYAMGSGTAWGIDAAAGDDGSITVGTLDTPVFTSEAQAQQFIQQIFRALDPNTLVDL